MITKDDILNFRVSSAMRALVAQGGEQSASARALLIIGAAAAGLDISGMQMEALDLISARLRPEICARLRAISEGQQITSRAVPAPTAWIESTEADVDDEELLGDEDGAGFDV